MLLSAEATVILIRCSQNVSILLTGPIHTKAVSQAMMEVFCAFTSIDIYGRIKVISSTQIPFHARRIVARGLNIPKSKVRVVKPRIGGGFGAKQTAVVEIYPAFVTS